MMYNELSRTGLAGSLVVIFLILTPTIGLSKHQPSSLDSDEDIDLAVDSKSEIENSIQDADHGSEEATKFSWRNHQDDHSMYAHRSLMSTDNIIHPKSIEKSDGELLGSSSSSPSKHDDSDDEYEALKTVDYAEKEWQLMFRAYDLMYDSVSSSILQQVGRQTNLFDNIVSKLKPECKRDIYHTIDSVKKHKLWALRMLDSNGKLPSGITYGRFASPGDYEECLSVNINEMVYRTEQSREAERFKFHGKYCLIDFRLPMPERPRDKLLSVHEPVIDLSKTEFAKHFPDIKSYSGYASVFYEVGYMHAFCLPSTCDEKDFTKSLGEALEGLHIVVNSTVDCEEHREQPLPLRKSQVVALAFLILIFANAFCASILHYMRNELKPNRKRNMKLEEAQGDSMKPNLAKLTANVINQSVLYTECFSIQTNFNRLTKPDPRGLAFVHYTRIVAMALTVITHTAGLGTLQAVTKPADASNSEQIFRDLIPQMLANAFTSIQIFFFMAGFMLVISTYPSIKREKGHASFLEYAIKRAIRLMPGLAITICLNFLWPLIVNGPMLTYFVRMIMIPCESTWWRTMSFLSNFDHVEKMCLRHSYFSASDYQLHIMAFPLLLLLYKQPTLSLVIAGILTVAGFVAQVIMTLTKTVMPFMMIDYIDKEAFFNVVHYIHHPVWNHMSAFFYGFIIGYLVVKQIRIEMSETTIKRLWFIILPSGIASIFAPYFWNHYRRPIYKWQMVLYVLFDRFILLTACAWLSYATMVLGRKKRPESAPKQQQQQQQVTQQRLNLPEIVTLDQDNNKLKSVDGQKEEFTGQKINLSSSASFVGVLSNEEKQSNMSDESSNRLKQATSTIPRQRSSPNIAGIMEQGGKLSASPTLRPSISSVDLNLRQQSPTPAPTTQVVRSAPEKKHSQAPVTNVNTLCLILSRLTFQLYLFNMVVLWIDVNQSKYFWFFSYYFIITKALAIYICSSLLAMVFFITLESPCLTLYIMWVKSRAQARAKRSEKNKQEEEATAAVRQLNTKASAPGVKMSVIGSHEGLVNRKLSPESLNASYDGLCMRSGARLDQASLSFIDLTAPSNTATALGTLGVDDQTKM